MTCNREHLTTEHWLKARLLREQYKLTYTQIGERFGVSPEAIREGLKRGEGLGSSS